MSTDDPQQLILQPGSSQGIYLGTPCEYGPTEFTWRGETTYILPCGYLNPYHINGSKCSTKSFLKRLMTLPQPIRKQIYELATVEESPFESPAYWLTAQSHILSLGGVIIVLATT